MRSLPGSERSGTVETPIQTPTKLAGAYPQIVQQCEDLGEPFVLFDHRRFDALARQQRANFHTGQWMVAWAELIRVRLDMRHPRSGGARYKVRLAELLQDVRVSSWPDHEQQLPAVVADLWATLLPIGYPTCLQINVRPKPSSAIAARYLLRDGVVRYVPACGAGRVVGLLSPALGSPGPSGGGSPVSAGSFAQPLERVA